MRFEILGKRYIRASIVGSVICIAALFVSACEHGADRQGRSSDHTGALFYTPTDRHPITVSKADLSLSIPVARHDVKLVPSKLNELRTFLHYYREQGIGHVRMTLPANSAYQYAVHKVLKDVQRQMEMLSIGPDVVSVKRYSGQGDRHPVIHLTYKRYVAKGPVCGYANENFNDSEDNANAENWGCASQRNLAAMVANPRDLQGPRGWSPRDSRRRDRLWDKFVKGEVSSASRSSDERVSTVGK